MALDKHVAEQRRFARLLGTDSDRSGLPVGAALGEADLDLGGAASAPSDDTDDGGRRSWRVADD